MTLMLAGDRFFHENSFPYRSLPPVAKQYVLRLLFIEQPVSGETMRGWAKPEAVGKHKAAMERLDQLRVLLEAGGK